MLRVVMLVGEERRGIQVLIGHGQLEVIWISSHAGYVSACLRGSEYCAVSPSGLYPQWQ